MASRSSVCVEPRPDFEQTQAPFPPRKHLPLSARLGRTLRVLQWRHTRLRRCLVGRQRDQLRVHSAAPQQLSGHAVRGVQHLDPRAESGLVVRMLRAQYLRMSLSVPRMYVLKWIPSHRVPGRPHPSCIPAVAWEICAMTAVREYSDWIFRATFCNVRRAHGRQSPSEYQPVLLACRAWAWSQGSSSHSRYETRYESQR